MPLFVVIAPNSAAGVRQQLAARFPGDYFEVSADSFVVNTIALTSQQVSDHLLITANGTAGPNAGAAVFGLNGNYWGHFNRDLWEWIQVKGQPRNG